MTWVNLHNATVDSFKASPLAIAGGGTGATTVDGAVANLGIDTKINTAVNNLGNTVMRTDGSVVLSSLTGGNGNTTGYRLISTQTMAAWLNRRDLLAVSSRHAGNGIYCIAFGCNASTITVSNVYCQIRYLGNTGCGNVVSSQSLQAYISPDATKLYFFYLYSDYDTAYCNCLTRFDGGLIPDPNGAWMTSIDTATYGSLKAQTQILSDSVWV